MGKLLYVVVFLFIAANEVSPQHNTFRIEDTIDGITVGKSTLGDLHRKFGADLIIDQGRHAVRINGECELFFDLEVDDSDQPADLVRNIQLLNLGRGTERQSSCNQITTGRGLRLSDSPKRVQILYGPSTSFMRNKMTAVGYYTRPRCQNGSERAVIIHDMGVEWLESENGLQNIYLGVTKTTCDEFNE